MGPNSFEARVFGYFIQLAEIRAKVFRPKNFYSNFKNFEEFKTKENKKTREKKEPLLSSIQFSSFLYLLLLDFSGESLFIAAYGSWILQRILVGIPFLPEFLKSFA